MPYIDEQRAVELWLDPEPETPEELAYMFCALAAEYIGAPKARRIIEVLGALEETKAEILRRVSDPHEEAAAARPDTADPLSGVAYR